MLFGGCEVCLVFFFFSLFLFLRFVYITLLCLSWVHCFSIIIPVAVCQISFQFGPCHRLFIQPSRCCCFSEWNNGCVLLFSAASSPCLLLYFSLKFFFSPYKVIFLITLFLPIMHTHTKSRFFLQVYIQ